MNSWFDIIQSGSALPEWPYPVRYGKENIVATDVLILGNGIAGSHAAINAARKGAKVAVVEKGHSKWSGAGGTGVDHWHGACTNPISNVSPEDYTKAIFDSMNGYTCGPARYIDAMESWDALLDLEGMGMRIRDVEDEFKGAAFRDEKTKLMLSDNYEDGNSLRVWGYNVKPCLYRELKRLGVNIYDRVMVTSLLTEGGKQGAKVVGATGINARTGEFYIFKAKAIIVSTGGSFRLSIFAPEVFGPTSRRDLNDSGVGQAIGWNAGAEFSMAEQSSAYMSYFGYAPYSMGCASNTWYGTSIVDANGKEVPYVDRDGRPLKAFAERFRMPPGQTLSLHGGIGLTYCKPEYRNPQLDPKLPEKIRNGEYVLPLYADLTRIPESERRVIFGMMVGNEGRTRIPVYDTLTKGGFNPDEDMLQAPVMAPEAYNNANFWAGPFNPQLRAIGGAGAGSGYLVDWDLRSSLEGLYVAGVPISGSGCHSSAAASGRYAGRKAVAYARYAAESVPDRKQVAAEKARVYAPLEPRKGYIGWKELNYAIARIMQDYCGEYRSEKTLKMGLRLLKELEETEGKATFAANPHELGRVLECFSLITWGEVMMHASLQRKTSSIYLNFRRIDFPQLDPPEWHKLMPIRLEDGKVKVRELPVDYHLKPPYAPTYEENYNLHCER